MAMGRRRARRGGAATTGEARKGAPDAGIPAWSPLLVRWRFLGLLVLFSLYPLALVTLPAGTLHYAAIDTVAMAFYVATWPPTRRARQVAYAVAGLGGAVLVAVVVATTGAGAFANSRPLVTLRGVMLVVFFAVIGIATLASVVRRGRITVDAVLGAICVYLLVGALWGVLYDLLTIYQPDAFRFAAGAPSSAADLSPGGGLSLANSIYFSYATLTTSGFGDIVPTTIAARTLAWMEAVTGQMYLAVMITRLVSLQIAHSIPPHNS